MVKKKRKVCNLKVIGEDEKGRPILEFSGDSEECGKVISVLASNKEVVIRKSEN